MCITPLDLRQQQFTVREKMLQETLVTTERLAEEFGDAGAGSH